MQKHGVRYIRRADIFAGYCYISGMKNFLYFTTVSGSRREAEFDSIKHIRRVGIAGFVGQYYSICVTGVVYTDTGKTADTTQFGLFALNDRVKYRGKTYEFGDLDRLCMVVENEKLKHVLDEL